MRPQPHKKSRTEDSVRRWCPAVGMYGSPVGISAYVRSPPPAVAAGGLAWLGRAECKFAPRHASGNHRQFQRQQEANGPCRQGRRQRQPGNPGSAAGDRAESVSREVHVGAPGTPCGGRDGRGQPQMAKHAMSEGMGDLVFMPGQDRNRPAAGLGRLPLPRSPSRWTGDFSFPFRFLSGPCPPSGSADVAVLIRARA